MVIAADYPFMDVLWTMLVFFGLVIWIWILIVILSDVFRRRDISGFAKVLWIIFVIVMPYLGVFVYLIVEHNGIADRRQADLAAAQTQMTTTFARSRAAGDGGDRAGQAAARRRHDLAGRVRRDQAQGARLTSLSGAAPPGAATAGLAAPPLSPSALAPSASPGSHDSPA